jgi:hypothetical protein
MKFREAWKRTEELISEGSSIDNTEIQEILQLLYNEVMDLNKEIEGKEIYERYKKINNLS